jgi:hypothetical protein
MKQKTKAKICFVIHITATKKLFFYFYDVIVKQISYKRSANDYVARPMRASETLFLSLICASSVHVCVYSGRVPPPPTPSKPYCIRKSEAASLSVM